MCKNDYYLQNCMGNSGVEVINDIDVNCIYF